ncbi:MAG: outer-membrane lipoprotein carrier protein LolA [Rickettsiales bacterium]|jgi:outer membrane lipoprotein-sorting protein|nr:outer-membrane lipoprotein carrier protein LolA [Rickettsiales bacterium]
MKIFKIIAVAGAIFLANPRARANYGESYKKLDEKNRAVLDKANLYFDSIVSFSGNFLQFNNADGSLSEGVVYIQKPDKIRFEYTNPFRILFLKNGGIINYYDIDLDELAVIPQKISPIFELLSKQDNLEKLDSEIISVVPDGDKNVTINTRLKLGDNIIGICYIFNGEITRLAGLTIDGGEALELSFFNDKINSPLDKKIFIFDNPRLFNNRKKLRNK